MIIIIFILRCHTWINLELRGFSNKILEIINNKYFISRYVLFVSDILKEYKIYFKIVSEIYLFLSSLLNIFLFLLSLYLHRKIGLKKYYTR
jgi:hypothetical protein